MDEFEVYTDDDGGFVPESARERINLFDRWYFQTTKRAFFTWWIVLGVASAYYFFRVSQVTYAIFGWSITSWVSFIMMFVFPTVGCYVLARVMVNWLHYGSLRDKCQSYFKGKEDAALKRLAEYRKRIV